MNQAHILFGVLGLAGVGAAGFLLLGDDGVPPPPSAVEVAAGEGGHGRPQVAQAAEPGEDLQRTAYEGGDLVLPPPEHAALAVSGRVVDPLGNPIAGARVRVEYRQGFGGFGNRDGGNRGGGNRGGGDGGGPGQFFGRGRRGQEATPEQQAQFEAMRQRFRPQPVADAVVTAGNGTYQLRGDAYSNSSLTIAVTHDLYAPAVERREWQSALGDLQVADIVLHTGVVVTGTVVDEVERPVPGAEVRFERAQEEDNPWGMPGGDRGNRGNRGGRGGRGGFGPGGFGNELADLVGAATTDVAGNFRLGPIPAEPFQLVATAERYLDGHGRRVEPADGQQLAPQRVIVVAAAGLRGVVRDAAGAPIANARITGEVAREAMFADMRAQREAATAQREAAAAAGQPTPEATDGQNGRRGRRGQGGPGAADFTRMREVMAATETTRSNEQGEFEFKKLPRAQVKLTAEHPRFLQTSQEPIDVQRTPMVVLTMPDALTISGTVVDAATGQPVELFGIAARRTGGDPQDQGPGQDQGWGRRGQDQNQRGRGNRGNDQQQEDAAATARTAARQKWLQDVLGPAGRLPGRTPQASRHEAGAFTVDRLQVGEYGLDVEAPGYVRTATLPVEVNGKVEGVVVRVERGAVLEGRVELANHAPVAGAVVELLLPQAPEGVGPVDFGGRGGFGGGPGGFGGFGGRGGGMRLSRVETDTTGRFQLPPVRPGSYRLRAEKQGLLDLEPVEVVLARAETVERNLVMAGGGTVAGVVRNLEPGVNARVTLTHAQDRSRHTASVDPATGAYRIEGLPAGGYFAALNEFGGADAMRTMLANAMAQRDKEAPDLTVAAGATVQYDLVAGNDPLGVVTGSVFFNGQPAVGMQVHLTRTGEAAGQQPADGNRGGRGNRGNRMQQFSEQLLRATVAADGTFTLSTVPPGTYQLEVQRGSSDAGGNGGRGGRGGRGGFGGGPSAMHKQAVEVQAFATQRVRVDLQTSEVEIKVALPEAVAQSARVRVGVALASEAANVEPQQWRRLESYRAFGLRNGTTGTQTLPPGIYRYQVAGRGIEPLVGELIVTAGQPQVLPLQATAAPEPAPGEAQPGQQGQPGDPNGGNRGRRGNRGQNGQNPGQNGGQQPGGQRQPGQGGRQRGNRQGGNQGGRGGQGG